MTKEQQPKKIKLTYWKKKLKKFNKKLPKKKTTLNKPELIKYKFFP